MGLFGQTYLVHNSRPVTGICLLESGCAGNQDPPHKSLAGVWHGAQKRAWELGQIMASWAVCSGKGKGEAGERARNLVYNTLLYCLQCGI